MALINFVSPHPFTVLKRKIKQSARQFRYSNDNSESLFHPDNGFAYGYVIDKVEAALTAYEETLDSSYIKEDDSPLNTRQHLLKEAELLNQVHPSKDVRSFTADIIHYLQTLPEDEIVLPPTAELEVNKQE